MFLLGNSTALPILAAMAILGIIPARYASTRFPGKPLVDIHGKSMIQRVVEQAQKAKSLTDVVVATDDERIAAHVKDFGGNVLLTASHHPSGTDRCEEAYTMYGKPFECVINIQGDEPFIAPEQIDLLASCFEQPTTDIATLVKRIDSAATLHDPNKVKVVLNANMQAMYFSRQAIPYGRNSAPETWHKQCPYYQHIGIYGYRTSVLSQLTSLAPSTLEKAESLEQLRWLEHGYTLSAAITQGESIGIDTPEDLAEILKNPSLF